METQGGVYGEADEQGGEEEGREEVVTLATNSTGSTKLSSRGNSVFIGAESKLGEKEHRSSFDKRRSTTKVSTHDAQDHQKSAVLLTLPHQCIVLFFDNCICFCMM